MKSAYHRVVLILCAVALATVMFTPGAMAKSMSIKSGIDGIVTPLHPGAEKFWKEKDVLK